VAGTYVGRILRGPPSSPCRRAVKIELLSSLRTAKSLGLTFGPVRQRRADGPFQL
jgi:hypothetical protein